ncbi:GGDEF domain-containing protein [Shewanella sp. Isolate11]|uniref:GGDEF domain-containing protein n=1 Tax=Shewanella sp. Isolate11 TaxID=2908530 RepID=UPI001EFC8C18|nr:GGDEF domain-containing protein [Shewanella sp. Isolate11]MCG9695641.1 GGDEF domain-containing protein [Shewanella sp. Isolate11]
MIPLTKMRIMLSILFIGSLILLLCGLQAQTKPFAIIDWFDVTTEGALLILGLSWLWLMLQARPEGRVTYLLILGLQGYCLGCYMDLLDEFFLHSSLPTWFAILEKLPTPIGLITLTYGLWLWREEQLTINEQLRTREQFYRQHQLVDRLTKIYDARSMRHQINTHLYRYQNISLIMLDIDDFSSINQQYGFDQGDRLLSEMAQLLTSQLRSQDLVCRFAGDRFIIMLPDTSEIFADAMAQHLVETIERHHCQISYVVLHCDDLTNIDSDQLIAKINTQMTELKRAKHCVKAS